uniref:Uncharacterized protein n=1 Tax=Plectus sambesii TaxID=2011161 RepID=A0A914VGB4_9BILA
MHRQLSFALFSLSCGLVGAFSIRDHSTRADCQGLWENMSSLEAWQVFFPGLDYPLADRVNATFRPLGACCLCCTCNITSVCQEYHITYECCKDPSIYINCCTTDRDFTHLLPGREMHDGTAGCSVPHSGHDDRG